MTTDRDDFLGRLGETRDPYAAQDVLRDEIARRGAETVAREVLAVVRATACAVAVVHVRIGLDAVVARLERDAPFGNDAGHTGIAEQEVQGWSTQCRGSSRAE